MLDVNNLTQTEKRIISLASSIKKEFTSESALIDNLIDDVLLQNPTIMNRDTMNKNGLRFKKIIRMEKLFNDNIYNYLVDRCFRIFRLYCTDKTRNMKNDWFVSNVLLFQVVSAVNSCIGEIQTVPMNDEIIEMMDKIEKMYVVPEKDGIAGTIANNPLITFFAGFGGASMADIFRDGKIGPNSMNSFLSGAPLNAAGSAFVVLMAKMVVAYKNAKYKKAAEEKLI